MFMGVLATTYILYTFDTTKKFELRLFDYDANTFLKSFVFLWRQALQYNSS